LVDAYNWRLVFLVNVPLGCAAWSLGRRFIVESRAPGQRVMPDLRGALLLSASVALLTLGVVQGTSWGWGSPATLGAFAAALVGTALTVRSSLRHPSPVLDPVLLRMRAFGVSNLITLVAGLGLYTYLLAHILWLHYVWGYSLLVSGLAVAPGAVVAAVVARPCGKLADRFGPRAVVVPGALVWAAAFVWYAAKVGVRPDFLGQWLPAQIASGIGVGSTLVVAAGGGLATVPAGRYATASAVNSSARQLGGVLGIAILTVFLSHPSKASLPGDLRHGWELAAGSFVAAAVLGLFFGPARPTGDGEGAGVGEPLLRVTQYEPQVETRQPSADDDLLSLLPVTAREEMLAQGTLVHLKSGETLFRLGETGKELYLLRSGRLRGYMADGAVREFGPGAIVGELAVLTDRPRSATIVATRDCVLVAIDQQRFEALAGAQPQLMSLVARGLAHRLMASRPVTPSTPPVPRVISLVALGPSVPLGTLAGELHAELARARRVARLDISDAEMLRPEVLQQAEESNDRVLLVAGPSPECSLVCLRQADRALLVASDPEPLAVTGRPGPCDVLLTGAPPTEDQVVRWVTATNCRRVYHLGADPSAWRSALRPLVARLAQQSLAVVLAGGGARALAHLGVLQALEDAGIQVDRLAGTSTGAFIAALYATGLSAAEVERRAFEELVQRQPFGGLRLSRVSLSAGDRRMAMVRRCFGETPIEALSRELVVVSTDLYERKPVYHRRGATSDAVAASMCLPGLFPPQRLDGRVLVDGSLTDNCPTAAFAGVFEGPVLAVRVSAASSPPPGPELPSFGETLVRVMEMGPDQEQAEWVVPTVTVTPDTSGVGLLEFHQIERVREAGLHAGRAAVAALYELPVP
jgi:predicted acylesterase/phospholipase RssA/CRP-like cAMP-binding protein